jgi:hypothetical protein
MTYAHERLAEERWYLRSKPAPLRAPDHDTRLAAIEARINEIPSGGAGRRSGR